MQLLFDEFEAALKEARAAAQPRPRPDLQRTPAVGDPVQLGERHTDAGVLAGGKRGRLRSIQGPPNRLCMVFSEEQEHGRRYYHGTNYSYYAQDHLTCLDEGFPAHSAAAPEVDNASILRPLSLLSQFTTISRSFRDVFRPFHLAAMFRTIVPDSEMNSGADGRRIWNGVSVQDKDFSLEAMAAEIHRIVALVTVSAKAKVTGGVAKLLSFPYQKPTSDTLRWHNYRGGMGTAQPGYLKHKEAREIFFPTGLERGVSLHDADLPFNKFVPNRPHVKDLVRFVLATDGTFQKLLVSRTNFTAAACLRTT